MTEETKKCPYCFEEIKAEAIKCRWCGTHLPKSSVFEDWYRDLPERRILGVASALAKNTSISVQAWRIILLVAILFHGLGLIAYFSIWFLTPFKKEGRSPLDRTLDTFRKVWDALFGKKKANEKA
jgi:phage shock protein PspC (stress-responsive transcriptional regulator)